MKHRLVVIDGVLYWRERFGRPQQRAGDKGGRGNRLKFNCEDYVKTSVVAALSSGDETLLELITKPTKAPRKPDTVAEVRKLLAKATSREDALAIYRTIELLETKQ